MLMAFLKQSALFSGRLIKNMMAVKYCAKAQQIIWPY